MEGIFILKQLLCQDTVLLTMNTQNNNELMHSILQFGKNSLL